MTNQSAVIAPDDQTAYERYAAAIKVAAESEMALISAGTKPYLAPETWRPVAYSALAPLADVTLTDGPLKLAFDRNIEYLNRCFQQRSGTFCDTEKLEGFWLVDLPASNEGRMLAAAAHTLRWGERSDMRRIVDFFVETVRNRQQDDGWCLPFDESDIGVSERSNYDRVGLTRGLIAAGQIGNPDAYGILRRFYDLFNVSPHYRTLLRGQNCNNGHEGGLLMYFSPVGRNEDLIAVERFFVQDFFIDATRNLEAACLDCYPLKNPHSYLQLAFQAWLDHYRACGATKYLDAAKGAWSIIHDHYEHIGGSIAICEGESVGTYTPGSYRLHKHTGETCGSVFWADFNHRFLQYFPTEVKYADEIEKAIFNVILAAQDSKGSIRYHNNLDGRKDEARCINTCCEVMGAPFIAKLPQYVYSVDLDGIYVNLFASSKISFKHQDSDVSLTTTTAFPHDGAVRIIIEACSEISMKIRIRVPSWSANTVRFSVNGVLVQIGEPGKFVEINRQWRCGDVVTFEVPMALRLVRYSGIDKHPTYERFALLKGPILLALLGGNDIPIEPAELLTKIAEVDGEPLHFALQGFPALKYVTYAEIDDEQFTCFPTMR